MAEFFVPAHVRSLIERLNASGYECFVVGGFLRDLLLGRPTHDVDLATSARPETVMALFSDYRTIPTGLIHGTVTVLAGDDAIEVTSFRKEGAYSDHRRPDEVWFTQSIEEDLKRRDFTINAMAWHPDKGLLDPFGGRQDLSNGVIRAVGEASDRFSEDALRILRALRLAAELGFAIEEETSQAMLKARALLSHIAQERITVELRRILKAAHFASTFTTYRDIVAVILPEIVSLPQFDTAVERAALMDPVPELRLAALLYDHEQPEIGEAVARRLRFSNDSVKWVDALVSSKTFVIEADKRSVWRALHRLGAPLFLTIMSLRHTDLTVCSRPAEEAISKLTRIEAIFHDLIGEGKDLALSDLAVDGHDLESQAYRGKAIGDMLEYLLERVCVDDVPNRRDALLSEIALRGGEAR